MAVMRLKVANINHELPGVSSVIFKKPPGFNFYAGQYLDYELPVKDPDGNTRSFTIASSPTEDFLMLSTKNGKSVFKKNLLSLKPGTEVKTSHPAGTFTLDEKSPAVMIAGGIGITPFRSMIKYALDQKLTTPMTLIYSSSTKKVKTAVKRGFYLNSDENFPFKKELDAWKQNLPNLNIIYHNSSQNGHLTKLPAITYHLPIYYLAGPPKMVDSFEKMLLEMGVEETNIRYDRFGGY